MTRSDPTTTDVLAAVSAPLPTDAVSVTRRRFLQAAALAGGVAVLPTWMAEMAEAAVPVGPGDGILVLITMGGGNDGLNTVIPIQNGTYYDRRRSLAIPASSAIAISDDRALHPGLGIVNEMWRRGDVAVIDGVGAPGTDLSHFSSMARWMAGSTAPQFRSGWLGRYLDGLPGGNDPFHGVTIGSSIPLVVQGQHRQASGVPPTANGILEVAGLDPTYQRQYAAVAALGNATTGRGELADALAVAGRRAVDMAATIEPIYGDGSELANPLAQKLDLCARLINANVGIRVLTVAYGDFDSHAGQPEMHNARMAELDGALRAFFARLDTTYAARTLILTVSEFGRRVKANRSNGTDHGAASTLLALGTQVRGGFYGQLPSLDALDRQGNLVPTVDFRSVYATVLDTWLQADANQILGGGYENLGFLAAPAPNRTTSGLNPTGAGATLRYRAEIVRLYKAYFGRLPDSAGLDHWVDARRSGVRLVDVSDAFAGSGEFVDRYGHVSNGEFVTLLYRNVLGRSADSGGHAHWTSVLDGGKPRGEVMVGFSESPEFVAASVGDVERTEQAGPIARLYLAYFLRQPDTDGVRYWIGTNLPYRAISDAFASSTEFSQRYGSLGNDGFIDLVYRNVLGRAADGEGRAYWLGEMGRGVTRGQVMLGFSESAEFITKTNTLA